jgi:hypothetical protein
MLRQPPARSGLPARLLLFALLLPGLASASTLDAVIPRVKEPGGACGVDRSAGCYGARRLRIGVLTLGTRDAHPISLVSSLISTLYTEKHGYDFIVERCATTTVSNGSYMWDEAGALGERRRQPQIVWSKSLALLKHLPQYDVLFFHDSDVFFVNHSYTIESFVDTYMVGNGSDALTGKEKSIAFGENCIDENFCWNGFPGLNTGMIMVRNTPASFDILADWARAADDGRCAVHLFAHPREQNCFDFVVRQAHEAHLAVIDTALWKGADGSWLVHLYSSGGGEPITVLAVRSFAYLMAQQHAHAYALLRNFTAEWAGVGGGGEEAGEERVPPWREHLHCEGGSTGCAHAHAARRKHRRLR